MLFPVVHLQQLFFLLFLLTGKNSASTGADRNILWHLDGVQQTFWVVFLVAHVMSVE